MLQFLGACEEVIIIHIPTELLIRLTQNAIFIEIDVQVM